MSAQTTPAADAVDGDEPVRPWLVDTHCHLNFAPLADDAAAVLDRARHAGVTRVVVPAYDPATWDPIEELATAHAGAVFPALGLHPWVADHRLDLDDLAHRLRRSEAVAVGEIGLDARVDQPALTVQVAVLERQLELACDLDLPVILHCRGAFEDLAGILARFTPRLSGVLHAFARPAELAARFVGLGLHLGLGGAVTRPRARVRAAVAEIPVERLLLETDAPSIGLQGVPAQDAEPRHVAQVAAAVAELRGEAPAAVTAATTLAAERLFGLGG
jgi:TatD DNase family protein